MNMASNLKTCSKINQGGIMYNYLIKSNFYFDCGFPLSADDVVEAIVASNEELSTLPSSLYRSIDYKTTSAMIGCILCDNISKNSENTAITNPIEKGHPDILPITALDAIEEKLRNYPTGLEVKCTIGGIAKGSRLRKTEPRFLETNTITWQAHHQEVTQLLGITYDYIFTPDGNKPFITAAFYSDQLITSDWGEISGTTGRNTKVCGMLASGKRKMADGWFAVVDDLNYISLYEHIFKTNF